MNEVGRTRLLIDCSLSLINRSAAHYIAEDFALTFGGKGIVRRWRLLREQLPTGIARKIFGRLMLREIALLGTSSRFFWPKPTKEGVKNGKTLFTVYAQSATRERFLAE